MNSLAKRFKIGDESVGRGLLEESESDLSWFSEYDDMNEDNYCTCLQTRQMIIKVLMVSTFIILYTLSYI